MGDSANFPSAQNLAVRLARSLDLDPSEMNLAYDSATKELTYRLNFTESVSTSDRIDFGIDLAEGLADLDVSTDANVTGSVELELDFGIDIDDLVGGGDPLDWFFIQDASAIGSFNLNAADIDASARLGFLDVEVVDGSGMADVLVNVSLQDPGTGDKADGRIDLRELGDALKSPQVPGDLVGSPT